MHKHVLQHYKPVPVRPLEPRPGPWRDGLRNASFGGVNQTSLQQGALPQGLAAACRLLLLLTEGNESELTTAHAEDMDITSCCSDGFAHCCPAGPRTRIGDDGEEIPAYYYEWASQIQAMPASKQPGMLQQLSEDDR